MGQRWEARGWEIEKREERDNNNKKNSNNIPKIIKNNTGKSNIKNMRNNIILKKEMTAATVQ